MNAVRRRTCQDESNAGDEEHDGKMEFLRSRCILYFSLARHFCGNRFAESVLFMWGDRKSVV